MADEGTGRSSLVLFLIGVAEKILDGFLWGVGLLLAALLFKFLGILAF